ncbi:hypothetical protein GCM10025869_21890 [Homoserinibacter gongjuensis]|uniref:Aldehyde dehydrogenase domain-containing protein n=1 Tax=Homoserinibacter gongjuensis TaxID=1162968 RepID=A0ABQ6JXZ6_9MICO|nr:hypothetical protein GCM10025869_21890 [Homoserinibacter gongjuensis]
MTTEILDHWVGGAVYHGGSSRTAPVYNPAKGVVQKEVRLASVADVDHAVQAAKAAFPAWADMSWAKRQNVMFNFREILHTRREELAAILTAEHGKVTSDALGEIARGLEVVEFACGVPHLAKGSTPRTCRPGSTCTRCASRSGWWRSSVPSISRRWCPCGSSRSRSRRATPSC